MSASKEIFSFHLVQVPLTNIPSCLFGSMNEVSGLNHAEKFLTMNLGSPVFSASRYNFQNLALFGWWKDEQSLDDFLDRQSNEPFSQGWHVRMSLYRIWGQIAELKEATVFPELRNEHQSMVAVTLARLNVLQARRFVKWGKPVESQVRDHRGQVLALAALRPLNTFSTFSIWRNEKEMINMVQGRNLGDGANHKSAMQERNRRDFHHEFMTMRFAPFKEIGSWNGKSNYLAAL